MKRYLFRDMSVILLISVILISAEKKGMLFGGKEDVQFAESMWKAMKGYDQWRMKSTFYPGISPHGKILRLYYNIVDLNGKPYHVIIKDNYGGKNADVNTVAKSPDEYLMAVTIMVQRKPGYDPENNDWFWAKYLKDGSLAKTSMGVAMAGRVAEGTDAGCIACHKKAGGGDYMFTNDG